MISEHGRAIMCTSIILRKSCLSKGAKLSFSMFLSCTLAWATAEDRAVSRFEPSRVGGRLVVAQRAEPKTLNPVAALDVGSREVISLITSSLIDIDQESFAPVAAIARSWTRSSDGRRFIVQLRHGLQFCDGYPFDADDVLFTFRVHEDESTHSPQRELLIVAGKPIAVTKLDAYTVQFDLAAPYSAAERLFAGIGILPRHLLEKSYQEHRLAGEWGLTSPVGRVVGLGPFMLKEYVPGERLVLARNPYYWKTDVHSVRLPYLEEIVFVFTSGENAQVLRFLSGEADLIEGLSPENFLALKAEEARHAFRLYDLGPGLEYTFLVFNQNDLTSRNLFPIQRKQTWFHNGFFRQAISAAIDRDAIVRLAYRGMASPIWAQVTEGNKLWLNENFPRAPRSITRARDLLRAAGFSWSSMNRLLDPSKNEVSFSILTSAGNSQREKISTLVQDDLRQIGITASIVSLEFRSMMDRIFNTYNYEAAVMTLASGDVDPNSEMNVWTVNGSTHLWNLGGKSAEGWERDVDQLMRRQLVSLSFEKRKQLYGRVQQLVAVNLPIICLASPHVLVGAAHRVQNLHPSILRPYALWNADALFLEGPKGSR
jgi:peptide/nickel transport system substrate-binding protein